MFAVRLFRRKTWFFVQTFSLFFSCGRWSVVVGFYWSKRKERERQRQKEIVHNTPESDYIPPSHVKE